MAGVIDVVEPRPEPANVAAGVKQLDREIHGDRAGHFGIRRERQIDMSVRGDQCAVFQALHDLRVGQPGRHRIHAAPVPVTLPGIRRAVGQGHAVRDLVDRLVNRKWLRLRARGADENK
jgi:hypothetical protein